MLRQAIFKHQNTLTEGWVEDDRRLRAGVRVKLEDGLWWLVTAISDLKLAAIHDAHTSKNWFKKDWLHNMGNKS